jgi:PAS domain S-box-containing protein
MSLAKKATLWVGLPFLIQALLSAILLFLLIEVQHLEDKEFRSKNLIGRTNWVLVLCLAGNLSSLAQKLSNQQIDLAIVNAPQASLSQEFKELCSSFESQDKLVESIQRMQATANELFQVINESKANTDQSTLLEQLKHEKRIWADLMAERHALLLLNRQSYAMTTNQGPRARERLHAVVIFVTCVYFLFAVILVYAFSQNITKRLRVLTDNTLLFANGKPLHELVPGNDELTDYDQTFHKMAAQIAESARKERAAHESLVVSEARVRAIIENMPLGLVALDTDFLIHSVNPSAEKLFGVSQEKLEGTRFSQMFDDTGERQLFARGAESAIPGHKTDLLLKRFNGELVHVDVSLTHFKNDQGAQLLACVQDTTQRHEVERLKREFLSMVSHDLRSPLTTIFGTIGLLETGKFGEINERGMRLLNTSSTEINRLTRLVEDLLDVAKIESGKFDLEIAPRFLKEVFERSKLSAKYLADQKGIKITVESTSLQVLGDEDRLVQVLVNLLTNAIKFSPNDTEIEISSQLINQDVEVRVKDHGRGIPESHLVAVFDRFRQVERTDATEKGGTGLGLAICKSIIEQHDGTIGVNSVVGQGTTFWFRLPAYLAAAEPVLPEQSI